MTIGSNIRRLRIARGLTQEAAATVAHVSIPTLRNYDVWILVCCRLAATFCKFWFMSRAYYACAASN